MGLNRIFEKAEKVEEERKLETVVTENSLIEELLRYYELSKKGSNLSANDDDLRFNFDNSLVYLENFKINHSTIYKVADKFNEFEDKSWYDSYRGIFLSALIQTSYNQGFNNFEFEELKHIFTGNFLTGKKDDFIRVEAKKIYGDYVLAEAEYCFLDAEIVAARGVLEDAKDCFLKAGWLIGDDTLQSAQNCIAEIINYSGKRFGWHMKDCTIWSPRKRVLGKLEKHGWYNNPTNSFRRRPRGMEVKFEKDL